MAKFLILLGGDLTVTERLKQQITGARVLAADGGMRHAAALDVVPELWLGDFDSTEPQLAAQYPQVERQVFPVAKAMTDGELALHEAYARGATEIILAGAFGGERTDHSLLHLTMATAQAAALAGLEEPGSGEPCLERAEKRTLFLTSGLEEATPIIGGEVQFCLPDDSLFSLIGFSALTGLTISGAEWPLDNVSVPFGSSLTLSNRVKNRLSVTLETGMAILIARPAFTGNLVG